MVGPWITFVRAIAALNRVRAREVSDIEYMAAIQEGVAISGSLVKSARGEVTNGTFDIDITITGGNDGYVAEASLHSVTIGTAGGARNWSGEIFVNGVSTGDKFGDTTTGSNDSLIYNWQASGWKGTTGQVIRLRIVAGIQTRTSGKLTIIEVPTGVSPRLPAQTTADVDVTITGGGVKHQIGIPMFDGLVSDASKVFSRQMTIGVNDGDTVVPIVHSANVTNGGGLNSMHRTDDVTSYQNLSGKTAYAIVVIKSSQAGAKLFKLYSSPVDNSKAGATEIFDNVGGFYAISGNLDAVTIPIVLEIQNNHYLVLENNTVAADFVNMDTLYSVVVERA